MVLTISIDEIRKCAHVCTEEALSAHKRFLFVIQVVTELTQAATATKGQRDTDLENLRAELEQLRASETVVSKNLDEQEDMIKQQETVVQRALSDYDVRFLMMKNHHLSRMHDF